LGSEDVKKLGNCAVSTKDITELVELVMRLMEEHQNRYHVLSRVQQVQSIPSTSSIPS